MAVYDADIILLLPDREPLPAGEEYYLDSLVLMDQLNESVVRDLFASNVGQTITLDPAVARTYIAQPLDPRCYSKKVLITNQVTTHFFDTQTESIAYTLHARSTAGSRLNTKTTAHTLCADPPGDKAEAIM